MLYGKFNTCQDNFRVIVWVTKIKRSYLSSSSLYAEGEGLKLRTSDF